MSRVLQVWSATENTTYDLFVSYLSIVCTFKQRVTNTRKCALLSLFPCLPLGGKEGEGKEEEVMNGKM